MARYRASNDSVNQLRFPNLSNPYRNQGLFADHFLKDRLPQLQEWQQVEGLDDAFKRIWELYIDRASNFTSRTNEAQAEHDFIRPVLDILWREQREGDCYQVQVSIRSLDARRQPDYAFFRTAKGRDDAEERKGTFDYWRDAPALGDAKRWAASLDKQRGMDENPSAQICNYLYRSRVRWGILTNGRIWRLYERDRSSTGGIFYEANLEDLLRSSDIEAFKYFYLFFRREAFMPDRAAATFLEKVFQGSVDYAAEVGDRLKESVYDALRHLMNGFLAHSANGLDPDDLESVKRVHENCLIVLYRLLFVLYAEDRNLLPCEDEHYHTYSLRGLYQEVNKHLRSRHPYVPNTTMLWGHLCNLFRLIDEGYKDGGRVIIPDYNGGLFSPSKYPHIAHTTQPSMKRWEIGDPYLAEAIDLLAYERGRWDEAGTSAVDYATLDVQHLGSIYEGLLELQPRIAAEPLVEMLKDGKPLFKPQREVPNPHPIHGQPPHTVDRSEVYLATDRGERKATGSYYTPKYIVRYIVENTVGPLEGEAARQAAALRPEVDKEIKKLERKRREWEKSSMSHAAEQIDGLNRLIEEQKRRLLEPYLSLKILDPAMGSGHFLVGAADFLSLAMATDPNLLPLDEIDDEDPQAFYKRLVVERCLYGVDLNPLAVELAKLSLWLHTVSSDKSLSFLDHHLRCGNSLIGARIEDDLSQTPPELDARGRIKKRDTRQLVLGFTETLTATYLSYFLDTFRKIMETPTGDAEVERMKDQWYREMDAVREKFRAVANCWLAPYFGVPVTPERYESAVKALRGSNAERRAVAEEKWFQDAQVIAHQKRFFHWELEFPEPFFDAHGFRPKEERGFDVVIGNPPWGADLDPAEESYCSRKYYTGQSSRVDYYALFTERAVEHLHHGGQFGYITPDTGLRKDSLIYWRDTLFGRTAVQQFVETGPLFPDVRDTWCLIMVSTRSDEVLENQNIRHRQINRFVVSPEERLSLFTASRFSRDSVVPQLYWFNRPARVVGYLSSEREQSILTKIENISARLGDLRDKFAISRGEEGSKFKIGSTEAAKWRLVLPEHIERHSVQEGIPISPKSLTDGKITRFYSHPKIWLIRIQKLRWFQRLVAGFDERKTSGAMKTLQIIVSITDNLDALRFLSGLIGSKLVNFWCTNYLVDDMNQTYLENLPIRRIGFTTAPNERARLLKAGKQFYKRCLSNENNHYVLEFVEHQLAQTPERADVVHDLLAFLAEQMIDMNKQKQTEVKGFFTWLERYIVAEIDDLRNKTKLRAYHEHDFGTLLDVLRQNRRKLGVNTDARDVQETIEREFSASVTKLTPLKTKIAATDRLIDLIVYRLYGLTEDEVAIVEGTARFL
jgi:hypothetical protein